jgi:tyrosine-protein kinase Etk/Wzc
MGEFLKFLADAKKAYDWVLIDTPPVLAVTDAMIIAEHVDLLLLVASMRSTHIPMFLKGIEELSRLDQEVAGIALNRFDWRVAYAYKHYYRAHYHYYGEERSDPAGPEKLLAAVKRLAGRLGGKRARPKGPKTRNTAE